ncbi:MAG TPA: glycosyl hydrolase [Rikenellaceae bacterium]|nr:glycosyl hydrolase [Rikenellaceae bacterium]
MHTNKPIVAILSALISLSAAAGPKTGIATKVESFPVSSVRLTSGPFKHAEDMDIRYLLGLDPDRLLAPYRKGAGLEPKAENYSNWENTGLDGHIGGHYVSALSYMYAATGNDEIGRRLDYMLSEMKACQEAAGDGYLCGVPDGRAMWDEIRKGNIRASSFGLNDRWVPLYNIHKTYAGLRDAYLQCGREDAKEMFLSLVEWMYQLTDGLTEEQMQDMLRSEHGGLSEVFADAAAISGEHKYMKLAHKFSQKALIEPLLEGQDKLTGMHANTQIPKVIGYKRIADLEGNREWDSAAAFFWKTVSEDRSISIGGNSVAEHFHPSDDFSSMLTSEQGPETCNTYNMLRLTKMLYSTSGDQSYLDFYERALYNHILSTQDPVQGGFVYFTPMRSGHYRVYSQPQTSFWCCVGSGIENHARYGEMIYGHQGDKALYVHLFIPSTLQWGDVRIEQKTDIPYGNRTSLSVSTSSRGKRFSIRFRIPQWTTAAGMKVYVNGKVSDKFISKDGCLEVERRWQDGDSVTVELPMSLRMMQLPDGSDNYSFLYGPVVLASRLGTDRQDGLFADDSRGGHIASGPKKPRQEMPVIVGDRDTILEHITKDADNLKFTLTGVWPEKYEGMILEPFFTIHECRYMVYWPLVSRDALQERISDMALMEKAERALDARTVDKVVCGEQQPESDHFVKMDRSNTGSDDDGLHWRETRGSFAYQLRNDGGSASKLMLRYVSGQHRAAEVYIGDIKVASIQASDDTAKKETLEVELPLDVVPMESLDVSVVCPEGTFVTPKFYEVRLVKQ